MRGSYCDVGCEGCSPLVKGGLGYRRVGASSGISRVVGHAKAAKSPLIPLLQRGRRLGRGVPMIGFRRL